MCPKRELFRIDVPLSLSVSSSVSLGIITRVKVIIEAACQVRRVRRWKVSVLHRVSCDKQTINLLTLDVSVPAPLSTGGSGELVELDELDDDVEDDDDVEEVLELVLLDVLELVLELVLLLDVLLVLVLLAVGELKPP